MSQQPLEASFLRNIHFSDILPELGELVTLKETDTVAHALNVLSQHHIHSAPLLAAAGASRSSIDMLDLVSYAVSKLDLAKEYTRKPQQQQVQEFLSKELKNLSHLSARNPWIAFDKAKSLKKALLFLAYPNIHRVWITEETKPLGVLTQSKMLEILLRNKEKVKPVMDFSVRDLFPEARSPRIIDANESLIAAFERIYRERVSGLAVVDQSNTLIGNISATDLQYCKFQLPEQFISELQSPIHEFLNNKKSIFGKERPFDPIVVKYDDTMFTAMNMAHEKGVHRVYVVDENKKPIQVISLTDMLAQFILAA